MALLDDPALLLSAHNMAVLIDPALLQNAQNMVVLNDPPFHGSYKIRVSSAIQTFHRAYKIWLFIKCTNYGCPQWPNSLIKNPALLDDPALLLSAHNMAVFIGPALP